MFSIWSCSCLCAIVSVLVTDLVSIVSGLVFVCVQ